MHGEEELITLFADGGLDPTEAKAFEARLAEDAELRERLRRARIVRRLIATLPRRPAPLPDVEVVLERLADDLDPSVAHLLDRLPRVRCPELDLFTRLRPAAKVEPVRALRWRRLVPYAAAAACLLAASAGLLDAAASRPEPRQPIARFEFTILRYGEGAPGAGLPSHWTYPARAAAGVRDER